MLDVRPGPVEEVEIACLAPKAWVHRVAGRMDESRELGVELAAARFGLPAPMAKAHEVTPLPST